MGKMNKDLRKDLLSIVDIGDESKDKKRRKKALDSDDSDDEDYGSKKRREKERKKKRSRSSDEDSDSDDSENDDDEDDSNSEFDDDEDDSNSEFDDGYGSDLIGDEKDREYLNSLPEIKREEILSQRQSKRDQWKEKQKIRNKLKKDRRSSSRRDKSSQQNKIKSSLKELKERKLRSVSSSQKNEESPEKKKKRVDSDSDSDSDRNNSPPSHRTPEKRSENYREQKSSSQSKEIKLDDLNRARLSRHYMTKWVHIDWFKDVCVGLYVRVTVGESIDKTPIYHVGEIVDVVSYNKVYQLDNTMTDKALSVKVGKATRTFRMEYCSNSLFTIDEFEKWKSSKITEKERIPTYDEIERKIERLEDRKNKPLTNEEIEKKVQSSKKLDKKGMNIIMERIEIQRLLDEAIEKNNKDEISKMRKKLEEIEALVKEEKLRKDKAHEDIAKLNLKHMKLQMKAEEEYHHATKKNPELIIKRRYVPSLRRDDEKMDAASLEQSQKAESTNSNSAEDIASIHNSFDIDISTTSNLPQIAPFSSFPQPEKPKTTKRHFNLEEYKAKKGLF